jgi:hypothetical protein
MALARSLHEILTGLAGGAGPGGGLVAALRAGGHLDLPDDLVAEAVASFAGTAPAEVAEHLAPFVMAHGPIAAGDSGAGEAEHLSDLLATVPTLEPPGLDQRTGADDLDAVDLDESTASGTDPFGDTGDLDAVQLPDPTSGVDAGGLGAAPPVPQDLAFGRGSGVTTLADDVPFDAVPPVAESAGPADPAAVGDPAPVDVESTSDTGLWAEPALPKEVPEVDDLDAS